MLGVEKARSLSNVVLVKDGQTYEKSDAVFEVLAELEGGWKCLTVFEIIPRFIRDGVYDFIVRHRYRWFGERSSCRLPTPAERELFLD